MYRDLRKALQSLSDQSLKTSRRLDDTHYAILEKVSILHQTIGTLQELSGLTKELQVNFESDTRELVEDVTGQVEGFEGLKTQQEHVSALEGRITAGKQRADALTARLARAKERVDARARAEAEWQATSTRTISHDTEGTKILTNADRLRLFWSTLGFLFALIVAFILFHHLKPMPDAEDAGAVLDPESRTAILNAPIPEIAKEDILGLGMKPVSPIVGTPTVRPLLEDDDRLRRFDEL